ncbi:MAG: hypothetical protein LC808_33565, partial [Actinobacteria bacterium]|nr:hypothetical protein [Actinomycetota bacterium]
MKVGRCLFLALIVVLVACDGSSEKSTPSTESPETALRRQIGYLSDGQYGRAYTEIHPAQQALFSADQYEACASKTAGAIDVESVTVKETFDEEITIPGTSERVQSTALTAEVKVKGIDQSQTDTY